MIKRDVRCSRCHQEGGDCAFSNCHKMVRPDSVSTVLSESTATPSHRPDPPERSRTMTSTLGSVDFGISVSNPFTPSVMSRTSPVNPAKDVPGEEPELEPKDSDSTLNDFFKHKTGTELFEDEESYSPGRDETALDGDNDDYDDESSSDSDGGLVMRRRRSSGNKQLHHTNSSSSPRTTSFAPKPSSSMFLDAKATTIDLESEGPASPDKRLHVVNLVLLEILCTYIDVMIAALDDPDIGSGRLYEKIQELIVVFGAKLSHETIGIEHFDVEILRSIQIQKVSTNVTLVLAQRIEEKASKRYEAAHLTTTQMGDSSNEKRHSANEDGAEDDTEAENIKQISHLLSHSSAYSPFGKRLLRSTDEDKEDLSEGPEDETRTRYFILDSNACVHFKKSLLEYVHKPYEKRILTALGGSPFWEMCQSKVSLTGLARELSWVPTNLVSFSHDRSLGTADLLKGYIEDTMGETWNWSPMEGRRYRLEDGSCRLNWKAVSVCIPCLLCTKRH
jgi:hypothetical protein